MAQAQRIFGDAGAGSLDNLAEIHTPENVAFSYELAGPFRRFPAFCIDVVVRFGLMCLALLAMLAVGMLSQDLATLSVQPASLLLWFVLEWFYGGILETFWNGQTVGKRLMRLRVVSTNGLPVSAMQAILRNLLRYIDIMPFAPLESETGISIFPTCAVGLVTTSLSRHYQRLGDLVAGTMVVVEATPSYRSFDEADDPGILELARQLPMSLSTTRAEAAAVLAYCERCHTLSPSQRSELIGRLAQRWRDRYGLPGSVPSDRLAHALYYRLFVSDQIDTWEQAVPVEERPAPPTDSRAPLQEHPAHG